MINLLDQLDDAQREAVQFDRGACLIAAGPGSGKTRVLTYRMAYLISQGVPASRILMLTFTKSAGDEMAQRVAELTGIEQEALARNISTFHSLGARILLSCQWALPFKLTPRDPIQPSKCRRVLQKICSDWATPYRTARSYIALQKRHDVSPEEAAAQLSKEVKITELFPSSPDFGLRTHVQIYAAYESGKEAVGALDYDDLIFWAGRLLRGNQRVRERYQNTYDYVMVDEFPDTDISQLRLVDAIAKRHGNIAVVGDPSQAIFSWRGGDLKLFLSFGEWYPAYKKILLARNYRSLPPVVDCYKKIIKGAPSVVDGFLEAIVAHRTQGGPEIGMWTCESDTDEATRVAEELDERTQKAIYPLNSSTTYAIIVRTNRQMRVFEEQLSHAGVPYMIVGASSFFSRPEVKTVMAHLCVLEDPCDDDAMEQVILGKSKLTKYLGKAYAKELRAYAGKRGMLSVMDETGKPWQRQKGREIQQFFEKIEHEYGNLEVAAQLRAIVAQAGIVPALTDEEDFDEIDNSVEENIEELIRAAEGYADRADFIDYADQLCRRPSKTDVPVKILTVHRAKGREFDVVYLCGFNDDLIPHKRAEDIEEERRIAYVAISRAKDELVISSYGQPSRFLKYFEAEELP